jgi:hypothetical protein
MRLVIIILLGLAYLLSSPILNHYIPNAGVDWHQYAKFMTAKTKVYECMFFLFFWLLYLQSVRMVKSLAAGMMVLTAGSVVDKLIFGFYGYLYTDYLLGAVAIIISIVVYVRENRRGG